LAQARLAGVSFVLLPDLGVGFFQGGVGMTERGRRGLAGDSRGRY
jgi:hypothetical protein